MRLNRIAVPREILLAMPEDERTFLIAIGHLLNELTVLNKLFYRCSQYPTDDTIIKKGQATQAICMAKILAGKLALGWEMMRNLYFITKLSSKYDPLLSTEASEARRELGRYFGNSNNLILAIRNRYAFHYDPKQLSEALAEALAAQPEQSGWEMFLTDDSGNSLYYFSEMVVGHSLLDHINPASHEEAMNTLIDDLISIGGQFITFLTGCLIIIRDRYLLDNGALPIEPVEIDDPPEMNDVLIPFFVLLPSEE